MEQSKLDRINQLARLAKERPLTREELAERDLLRKAYIAPHAPVDPRFDESPFLGKEAVARIG